MQMLCCPAPPPLGILVRFAPPTAVDASAALTRVHESTAVIRAAVLGLGDGEGEEALEAELDDPPHPAASESAIRDPTTTGNHRRALAADVTIGAESRKGRSPMSIDESPT